MEVIMIRLFSTDQAINLRGIIPELAVIRSIQFQSSGYSPETHGHIIVIQEGDDLTQVTEISPSGLVLIYDSWPAYEYAEAFIEEDMVVYEVVFQINNERTIAVIIPDQPWLDAKLRSELQIATQASKPTPLPSAGPL